MNKTELVMILEDELEECEVGSADFYAVRLELIEAVATAFYEESDTALMGWAQ